MLALSECGCPPASVFVSTFTCVPGRLSIGLCVLACFSSPAHAIIACTAFACPEYDSVVMRSAGWQ